MNRIKFSTIIIPVLFWGLLMLNFNACKPDKACTNCNEEMNAFITDLMHQMTIEEKIGQLNLQQAGHVVTGQAKSTDVAKDIAAGKIGALLNTTSVEKLIELQKIAVNESRLHIPLIMGLDVIHGYKTTYPIPLAMSCSWDTALIRDMARTSAIEATADGIFWTFSPMVDLSRDPRWGRVAEGSGEDPFLGSQIAKVMVEGYQGTDLAKNNTMMACVKHFALYGAPEAGRDYNTVDMSRLKMYNVYFPPYKAAIDAGALSVMTSFNDVDGLPATANPWLLNEVLRKQWHFKGFVVTDYTTIEELIDHGLGDLQTVAAKSVKAGTDMDMISNGYIKTLKKSLDEGKISVKTIDKACRRILEAKYKLGLFDDPYKYFDTTRRNTEIYTTENLKKVRKAASQTFVLLKNENDILPLKKSGTIALIGPMVDNKENMLGTWAVSGDSKKAISLYEGLKAQAGNQVKFLTARGANVVRDADLEAKISVFGKPTYRDNRPETALIREALQVAQKADVIVAAMGESAEMSGECSSLTNIQMPANQRELLMALKNTGKPIVLVLFSGRPMAINWEKENIPAILNVWFGGSQAGYAMADVLFGKVNPSGKLTMTFPQNVGQIPMYYNYKNTGRPLAKGQWFSKFTSNYLDVSNDPVYPFGYGLSYTNFDYTNFSISDSVLSGNQILQIRATITNTGKYAGAEIVQLYTHDMVASITRPVQELKGFRKIWLEPGEQKQVVFKLTKEDMKFYNYDLDFVFEPGEFEIMLGPNSQQVDIKSVIWN